MEITFSKDVKQKATIIYSENYISFRGECACGNSIVFEQPVTEKELNFTCSKCEEPYRVKIG